MLQLKPYEDPITNERLRGATGMTYTYGESPGWTLLVLASDGWAPLRAGRGAGYWIEFDHHLTALGVFRQCDWLLRSGRSHEFKVVPSD